MAVGKRGFGNHLISAAAEALTGLKYLAFFFGLSQLLGCQLAPTRGEVVRGESNLTWAKEMYELNENTVLVDARGALENRMAPLKGTSFIRWNDFLQNRAKKFWELESEPSIVSRRLALKGVSKDSEVIVLAPNKTRIGDAGQVAFALMYYGVEKVTLSDWKSYRNYFGRQSSGPVKNAAPWTELPKPDLLVDKNQLTRISTEKVGTKRPSGYIVDVRSKEEYFQSDSAGRTLRTVHIDWREFFDEEARPSQKIHKIFGDLGLKKNDQIVVLSNQGGRSSAVLVALRNLGYSNSSQYLPGYKGL